MKVGAGIKLHGFGGPSQFWNYNLESFTLMAGLAAMTLFGGTDEFESGSRHPYTRFRLPAGSGRAGCSAKSMMSAPPSAFARLLHHSTVVAIQGESYQLKDRRRAGVLKTPTAEQSVPTPA